MIFCFCRSDRIRDRTNDRTRGNHQTRPGTGLGTGPVTGQGHPLPRKGWGYPLTYLTPAPRQDRGTPSPQTGPGTGFGTGPVTVQGGYPRQATPLAVRLLRSRRRTFLLEKRSSLITLICLRDQGFRQQKCSPLGMVPVLCRADYDQYISDTTRHGEVSTTF